MSNIVLSASVRQNLLSLQSTAELLATTQERLSTGKKVNTALDNPTNSVASAQDLGIAVADKSVVVSASSGGGDQFYLERIEALQAKLNLFIQEANDRAREEQEKSTPGTEARKAAQQDARIASLMAEGQKLSEKELRHVGTIRRLQSRTTELEASLSKARKAESDAQREIGNLRVKVDSSDKSQKTSAADVEARAALERQLDQARKQNEAQTKDLVSLRHDLDKARASSELKDQLDKQKQLLDAERRTVADLKEELDNAKIERELGAGRQKTQLDDEKNKALQYRERAVAREAELEGELKALETRLETLRTKREEETGGTGDQQAKQLRQIEALQRQYSVSKENWGSVEASLNSRILSLEGERDDLAKKETELRRKLREATSNLRKRDEELENLRDSHQELEDRLKIRRQLEESTINDLQISLKKAQGEAENARDEVKALKASLALQAEIPAPSEKIYESGLYAPHERSQSPLATRSRGLASAYGETKDRRQINGAGFFTSNGASSDRPPSSRKISIASPHGPSSASFGQQSFQSLTRSSSRSALQEANSIDDERDTSDGLRTPATPGRGFNGIVSASASNPAAGPSVQLVERMSAAVRRLESEKAATRDELDRMSLERDEARKQVVALLEEVDSKRTLDKKVSELEQKVAETSQRYQTTLELLGEKSEAVEELKADIADMKQIYRDALEKSMK